MKVLTSMMGSQEVITAITKDLVRYKLRREPTSPFEWQAYDHKGEKVNRPSRLRQDVLNRLQESHYGR